jgi:hypothetical protein
MALVRFRMPGQDGVCYVRSEGILALSAVFRWSPSVDARTVYLTTGATFIVEDSDASVGMAVRAMGTQQDADDAVADERTRRRRVA